MKKPDYKNWVPTSMVIGLSAAAAASGSLLALFGTTDRILKGRARQAASAVFGVTTPVLLFYTAWMGALHKTFDYNGERKLAKVIIDGTADFVTLPDGGTGLDVGCGSGALTIACAKRNPGARMVGCDVWSGPYESVYSGEICRRNAAAEGVENVRFLEGNAVKLPFADEAFDAVTSNYVYHNVAGRSRQKLLLETLRVLKKGGTFAIHDLMSPTRYGDMEAFAGRLRAMGYRDVRLIDTTRGLFLNRTEALALGLGSSTLLTGRK